HREYLGACGGAAVENVVAKLVEIILKGQLVGGLLDGLRLEKAWRTFRLLCRHDFQDLGRRRKETVGKFRGKLLKRALLERRSGVVDELGAHDRSPFPAHCTTGNKKGPTGFLIGRRRATGLPIPFRSGPPSCPAGERGFGLDSCALSFSEAKTAGEANDEEST